MAVFKKFNALSLALAEGKHNFSTDTFYVQLLNVEPDATDAIETDLPADLSTGSDYTAGGVSCGTAFSSAQTGGTYKLCIPNKVITANGGTIGFFQYVALFNFTATDKDLIGYYDYGASIRLNDTETFTIDFSEVNGVLTIEIV